MEGWEINRSVLLVTFVKYGSVCKIILSAIVFIINLFNEASNISYCHVIKWLLMGFGLVIGFTELLQIREYK
jgi:hypothetical protein